MNPGSCPSSASCKPVDALLEFGPQKEVVTIDSVTTITGATIQLPHNWFVDLSCVYSESDGHETHYNQISKSRSAVTLRPMGCRDYVVGQELSGSLAE